MKIKLDRGAFVPERAHVTDAGADLRSPIDVVVPARGSQVIDTGVHIQLPHGYVGMLKSKSGLNVKYGITSEGVIDEGYTGAIKVKLYNLSDYPYAVMRGDKITQLVIVPCEYVHFDFVDKLDDSERGGEGFGSTGK
jgi:dUTP pyrophosphatase